MDNKKLFWIVIGIVIVVLIGIILWQTSVLSSVSGNSVSSAASAASAGSGMVGGC